MPLMRWYAQWAAYTLLMPSKIDFLYLRPCCYKNISAGLEQASIILFKFKVALG